MSARFVGSLSSVERQCLLGFPCPPFLEPDAVECERTRDLHSRPNKVNNRITMNNVIMITVMLSQNSYFFAHHSMLCVDVLGYQDFIRKSIVE